MLFTAKTGGCKISPQLTWRGGYTYGRFCQNQNFLDALITKFSYPWCSAGCASAINISWNNTILGDPGAVGQVGRKGGTKVFKYWQKSPWVATLTELFPKIQADAGSWLGTKNALYYCAQSANSFSWVLFVSSYTTAIAWMHQRNARSQQIKSPSDFKILSARKLKTLFQKYKLELTTGIHACIGHASDAREFLKDTTTADSHENVTWKSEFTFFQSLSWLFQLAYFVKCKWDLLQLNFY